MYVSNEGRRSWRGERGGRKGKTFGLYEGNWLGTKIDCIAVLFVCVGFLFGKLIFFNYTRFCLFFLFSSPLHTEITDAMISLFTNNNNISHVTFLPPCHQHISWSARQLVSNAVPPPPEILKIAHPQLCAYLDRGVGT